jgi:hypothetical protein
MAVAWNACDGITTENLEDNVPFICDCRQDRITTLLPTRNDYILAYANRH